MMRIVQINSYDGAGGAEKIAYQLHLHYQERGYGSWLIVGEKLVGGNNVLEIPGRRNQWLLSLREKIQALPAFRGKSRLENLLEDMSLPLINRLRRAAGMEDFEFPKSRMIGKLLPEKPDLYHAHNLHRDYFDLRYLSKLSRIRPLLITMHDAWLLSGHCAHSFECERWKIGCGMCPDLSIYPEIKRDATAYNWKRKQKIYKNSLIYLACPSRWLLDKAEISILKPSLQISRVIPNGVDLSIFTPANKKSSRAGLGLPQDARIVLSIGNELVNNPWKDYATMQAAFRLAGRDSDKRQLFLVVGQELPTRLMDNLEIRFIPPTNDPVQVALYYQSADIYLHAARADTFPTTVLEALACGCPVIATRVGGIPEQVMDGETGFLVPPADPVAFSNYIRLLFDNTNLRHRLADNAAKYALQNFGLKKMVDSYLAYYNEILQHWVTKTSQGWQKHAIG